MPLTDKRVCLFTGVSGTLGTAFCRAWAHEYHIAGVYRNTPPSVPWQCQRLVDPLNPKAMLAENDDAIFAIKANLTDEREATRVVELALARFERIDLLVNAAVHSIWAQVLDSDKVLRSAEEQFRINVILPLRLAAIVAGEFWRDRSRENIRANRNIINISSSAGVHVYPDLGQSVYASSKAALNHLTLHMAHEFAGIGVRVNAVAPNAFPGIVSTGSVVDALIRLDRGKMVGEILSVDRPANASAM